MALGGLDNPSVRALRVMAERLVSVVTGMSRTKPVPDPRIDMGIIAVAITVCGINEGAFVRLRVILRGLSLTSLRLRHFDAELFLLNPAFFKR